MSKVTLTVVGVVVLVAGIAGVARADASRAAPAGSGDAQAIRAVYAEYSRDVRARKLDAIMALYTPGNAFVGFDAFGPPSEQVGNRAYRNGFHYARYFALFPGPISEAITGLHIVASPTLAYAYGFDRWSAKPKGSTKTLTQVYRFTDVFEKVDGKWLIVHEHLSFPVDPRSLKAVLLSGAER